MGLLNSFIKKDDLVEKGVMKQISVYDLVPHEDNFYTLSDIESLEDAIEIRGGVKENLIVTPTEGGQYKVISGHRRRQAMINLIDRGIDIDEHVPCQVETFRSRSEEQIAIIIANMGTRKLSEWEKIEQYKRLKEPLIEYCKENKVPGRLRDFVSKTIGVSSAKIAKMDNIENNLIPELKEEMKKDNLKFSTAAELASLEPKEQTKVMQENKGKEVSFKDVQKVKREIKTKDKPNVSVMMKIFNISKEDVATIETALESKDIEYEMGYLYGKVNKKD